MNRVLTRQDLVVSGIVVAIWGGAGLALYLHPHSRLLWWLFWVVVVGPLIPRAVVMLVALGVTVRRVATRLRRHHPA